MSDHKDGNDSVAPLVGRRLMKNCDKILRGEANMDAFPVDVMTDDGITTLVAMLVSPRMAAAILAALRDAGMEPDRPEHQD